MTAKFYSPDKQKRDEERERIRKEIKDEMKQKEFEQKKKEDPKMRALIEKGPSFRKDRRHPPNGKCEAVENQHNGIEEIGADLEPDLPGWQNVANLPAPVYVDPPGLQDTDSDKEGTLEGAVGYQDPRADQSGNIQQVRAHMEAWNGVVTKKLHIKDDQCVLQKSMNMFYT